jgi:hypothetical protein
MELLNTIQVEEQVTPKSGNRKFFCSFTFWGHLTHAYNTVHERLNKNTYLTIINSSKITKRHILSLFLALKMVRVVK